MEVEWSNTLLIIWHSPLDTLPTTVCATASSSAAFVASATASCVLWRRILLVSKTDMLIWSARGFRGPAACGGLGGVAAARFRGRRAGRGGGRGVFLSEQAELISHPGVSPPERSQRIDGELTSEVFCSVLCVCRGRGWPYLWLRARKSCEQDC